MAKDRGRVRRVSISLTDNEKEKLVRLLNNRQQTVNELLTLAVWDFLKTDTQVELMHRVRGNPRLNRVNFYTSEFLYDLLKEKADTFARPLSEVVYTSVKNMLA